MFTYFVIKSQDASVGDTVFSELETAQYSLEAQKRIYGSGFHTLVIETSEFKRSTKDKSIKFLMRHDKVSNETI